MKTVIVEFGEADYKRLQARASLDGFKLCDYITDAAIMRLNENAKKPNVWPEALKPIDIEVKPICSHCNKKVDPWELYFDFNEDDDLILTCKRCIDEENKETETKTE